MKSVLFVWGGWEGHEPKQCVGVFSPYLAEQGYDVEISDTLDVYLDTEKMQSKDLIVQVVTMSTITETQEVLAELKDINERLARIEGAMDRVSYRVESLEEIREDLWPMIHGASNSISRKLHDWEQRGAVGFVKEAVAVGERVATSFSEEDVRLLGENVVSILQTVRNLTQPEILEVADRAAVALRESDAEPTKKIGLWKAMRDPEIRRGMTMMLSVLREMGHEQNTKNAAVVAANAE